MSIKAERWIAAWRFDSTHLEGKAAFATAAPFTARPNLHFPKPGEMIAKGNVG